MRLIDADALKKELKNKTFVGGMALYDVCMVIRDAPTIEIPQWISASEKLPDHEQRVLVSHSGGIVDIAYFIVENEPIPMWRDGVFDFQVLDRDRWMPIPEGYIWEEDE